MEAFLTYIPNLHPNAMLAFGMLLLLGVTGGLIANRIHLMPTITAFMLLGLLTGPHGLGLITADMMKDAHVIIDIALGLILYKLGNMLHPEAMLRSKRIMLTAILESLLTFAGVTFAVKFLGNSWTVAALIGAIAGTLSALYNGFISPDALHWSLSGSALIMAIVGGTRLLWGPALGGVVFFFFKDLAGDLTEHWPAMIGLTLIVVTVALPMGIGGALARIVERMRPAGGRRDG